MELINYNEVWVKDILEDILSKRDDICKCEQCRLDMTALALNRLKPSYTVSEHGSIHTRIKLLDQQKQIDLLAEVAKAVEQVSARPHHLA